NIGGVFLHSIHGIDAPNLPNFGRLVATFCAQLSEHGGALRKPGGGGAFGESAASLIACGLNSVCAWSRPTTPATLPASDDGADLVRCQRDHAGAQRECRAGSENLAEHGRASRRVHGPWRAAPYAGTAGVR